MWCCWQYVQWALGIGRGKLPRVFVFGTLKEGFPNFSVNNGVRYRSEFFTKKSFPLYLVGERYSPWLVLNEGSGFPVKGQVFDVSNSQLSLMDKLERVNEVDGYRRVVIDVVCTDSGDTYSVYMYGKPLEQLKGAQIKAELEGEYTLKHARQYRARYS